jgi:hypothetical protein
MPPRKNTPPGYRPMSRSTQSEPFQVFALQHRERVLARNPHLTASQLISTLSRMWRNLSEEQKVEYKDAVLNNLAPPKSHRRPRTPKTTQQASMEESTQLISSNTFQHSNGFPLFSILPRGSFGLDAVLASREPMVPMPQPSPSMTEEQQKTQ